MRPNLCRTLLAREQQRMRSEYEQRLRDLESERLTAEHDKAKVRSCLCLLQPRSQPS